MRGFRAILIAAAVAAVAWTAASFKLYLKDGSDHVVREYQVQQDRVRYYSLERGQWEEMPLDLVDLKRTEQERRRDEEEREERRAQDRIERRAEREARTELHNVPLDDGVYWINGSEILPLERGEPKVKGNRRRSFLKVITPIPIVAGKATVELEGAHSKFVVNSPQPQFYIRMDRTERIGIAKLTTKKEWRIVEELTIVPVSGETIEQQKEVEVFRQQLAPMVYKIWPVEPLEPGEYAVVQFTQDQVNIQVWDFAYRK